MFWGGSAMAFESGIFTMRRMLKIHISYFFLRTLGVLLSGLSDAIRRAEALPMRLLLANACSIEPIIVI